MKVTRLSIAACAAALLLSACKDTSEQDLYQDKTGEAAADDSHAGHDHGPGGHDHAEEDGAKDGKGGDGHGEDAHEEVDLGEVEVDGMRIVLKQAHGLVKAGSEGALIIKLPFSDDGASIVRAWIGGSDRTLSQVGKGEYDKAHDDYDVHAVAPTPLPADAQWWFEITKPDGTKTVGSIDPLR